MARPRLIIVIRHAQSESNKNRDIHQSIPDHRVRLTPEGWAQARDAGRRLRALLHSDDTLQFFTSPYRRTRETTEGILSTLTGEDAAAPTTAAAAGATATATATAGAPADAHVAGGVVGDRGSPPSPSPFRRSDIKIYEEPRLREQDFGNFQPCSVEMERMWQERADYGHFFYRIPNGESAADAYDRISGFNENLWRQFNEDDFPSVCVLVTHGLMSRVFLMKWYHFTVEYFEDLRNIDHCEFLSMRKQPDTGKYLLENVLRTWSDLRRERVAVINAAAAKDKDMNNNTNNNNNNTNNNHSSTNKGGNNKDGGDLQITSAAAAAANHRPSRRWGGCPNGCNHTSHFRKRHDLEVLRQRDIERSRKIAIGLAAAAVADDQNHNYSHNNYSHNHADNKAIKIGTTNINSTSASEQPSPLTLPRSSSLARHLSAAAAAAAAATDVAAASPPASDHDDDDDNDDDDDDDDDSDDNDGSGDDGEGEDASARRVNRLGDDPRSEEAPDDCNNPVADIDAAERHDRSLRGSVY